MQRPLSQCYGGIPYVVHPKDTLSTISKMFNISSKEILDNNPFIYNQNKIFVGQILCIPTGACPPDSQYYNIKFGDTFYSISKRFGISIKDLIKFNPNVNPNVIYVGQTLCLPSYLLRSSKDKKQKRSTRRFAKPCLNGVSYAIRPKDTLHSISRLFNVSTEDLIRANPYVDPKQLRVGLMICIPTESCHPFSWIYTVQKGDTYYNIAENFGISVSKLQAVNQNIKTPAELKINTNLCIPIPYWSNTIPDIAKIDTGFQVIETGTFLSSNQGYYIYILPEHVGFGLTKSRRDKIISYDSESYVIISVLFQETLNMHELREAERKKLSSFGKVIELKGKQISDPFFQKAYVYLEVTTEERIEQRIVLDIEGIIFFFILSLSRREAIDEVARFHGMLKTIKSLPNTGVPG